MSVGAGEFVCSGPAGVTVFVVLGTAVGSADVVPVAGAVAAGAVLPDVAVVCRGAEGVLPGARTVGAAGAAITTVV